MTLETESEEVSYLDLSVETQGYMYVLSYSGSGAKPAEYRLDIYSPKGDFVSRSSGVAAARLAVNRWRTAYTLNYEGVLGRGGRTQPSVSEWLPSTPQP
ncbi:MAG: hypothetical protein RBU37_28235 [Myxococcota bacterium]|nr:hypothetical protein [Myxococcota bacterium]